MIFVSEFNLDAKISTQLLGVCLHHYALQEPCLLESLVSTILVYRLYAFGGESECEELLKLRYVDLLLLEVGASAYLAARVILRRTSAVRVSSSDLGALVCYWADFHLEV